MMPSAAVFHLTSNRIRSLERLSTSQEDVKASFAFIVAISSRGSGAMASDLPQKLMRHPLDSFDLLIIWRVQSPIWCTLEVLSTPKQHLISGSVLRSGEDGKMEGW